MRCSSCRSGNLDSATICANCGTSLPAPGFSRAISRVEELIRSGRFDEAARQLVIAEAEMATGRPNEEQRRICEARVTGCRARIYYFRGEYRLSRELCQRAMTLLDDGADVAWVKAGMLMLLSSIAGYAGDNSTALDFSEQSLALAQQSSDRYLISGALNLRANIAAALGENEAALDYYQQALPHAEQAGSSAMLSMICSNIASLYEQEGDMKQALTFGQRALRVAEGAGDKLRIMVAEQTLGAAAARLGEFGQAEQNLQRALQLSADLNNRTTAAEVYMKLAEIAWLQGDYPTADDYARKFIANASEEYSNFALAHAIQIHAALGMQNIEQAQRAYNQLITEKHHGEETEYSDIQFFTLTAPAALRLAQGDWLSAQAAFKQALASTDNPATAPYTKAQVRLMYAEAMLTNQPDSAAFAAALLDEAQAIFKRMGAARELNKVNTVLAFARAMGKS